MEKVLVQLESEVKNLIARNTELEVSLEEACEALMKLHNAVVLESSGMPIKQNVNRNIFIKVEKEIINSRKTIDKLYKKK